MKISFRKYHGCGNDFILVKQKDIDASILQDLIVKICDRHTGIGADGFIVVQEEPLEMIYYNQDGSRAPMCGNGIRCFAQFCIDQGIVFEPEFTVLTLAGPKQIKQVGNNLFEVQMGYPFYENLDLVHTKKKIWDHPYTLKDGKQVSLYTLFQSTIHTVVFVDLLDLEWMEIAGKQICEDPIFEEKTNVNFVQILDATHIRMQTYERGCGMTLACGTGACASVSCAHRLGKCASDVHVELPKGNLQIRIEPGQGVVMTGPAKMIAKGEYIYESDQR